MLLKSIAARISVHPILPLFYNFPSGNGCHTIFTTIHSGRCGLFSGACLLRLLFIQLRRHIGNTAGVRAAKTSKRQRRLRALCCLVSLRQEAATNDAVFMAWRYLGEDRRQEGRTVARHGGHDDGWWANHGIF